MCGLGATGTARPFQFTPLREGRRQQATVIGQGGHFNSRPSARGDVAFIALLVGARRISIHAPPRGATRRWADGVE